MRQSHAVLLVAGECFDGLVAAHAQEMGVMQFAAACTDHGQEMSVDGVVVAMIIVEPVVVVAAVVVKKVVVGAILVLVASKQTDSLPEGNPFLWPGSKLDSQTDFHVEEKRPEVV